MRSRQCINYWVYHVGQYQTCSQCIIKLLRPVGQYAQPMHSTQSQSTVTFLGPRPRYERHPVFTIMLVCILYANVNTLDWFRTMMESLSYTALHYVCSESPTMSSPRRHIYYTVCTVWYALHKHCTQFCLGISFLQLLLDTNLHCTLYCSALSSVYIPTISLKGT